MAIIGGKSILESTLVRKNNQKSDEDKESAELNKEILISADHYYYLPTASLVIKASAKVVVTRADTTKGIRTTAELSELQLENSVTIEPDTSQLFSLKYTPFSFANDELKLNVNSSGLLESISATAEDRLSNIIAEISAAPKSVLSVQNFEATVEEEIQIKSVTTQTLLFTNIFLILSEELQSGSFSRNWKINIDVTDSQPTTADASFKCSFNPRTTSYGHLKINDSKPGLLTRPLHKIKLTVDVLDPSFKPQFPLQYEIMIPDHSVLIQVPVERAKYVKKIQTPKFSNGLLIENYINKPSEVEGFLSIPINILKAIFSIPAQLLSFKIAHIQKETALETGRQNLTKVQLQSKVDQNAKELELLKSRSQSDKHASEFQKNNLIIHKDLVNAQNDWNIAKNDLNKMLTKIDVAKTSVDVPENILIEAINNKGNFWMQQYSLKGVGIGKKKINEILSNTNCLVFKPVEKKELSSLLIAEVVPKTITFQSQNGSIYDILTDVQETGGAISPSYIQPTSLNTCRNSNVKMPGCSVSRINSDTAGTIGLKVYKNDKVYILSCYHIFCQPELLNGITSYRDDIAKDNIKIISPAKLDGGGDDDLLGNVIEGEFDDYLDCAIAELKDTLYVDEHICSIGIAPKKGLVITVDHVNVKYSIKTIGRTSGYQTGYITNSYFNGKIDYFIKGEMVSKNKKGLICTSRISDGGDSGAIVIDDGGNAIGMIIATAPNETYIIPIATILSELNLNIKI